MAEASGAAEAGDARLAALQRLERLAAEREYEERRLAVLRAREQANRDAANELRFGSAGDALRRQPEVFAAVSADLMLQFAPAQAEGVILREQTDLRAKITEANARIKELNLAVDAAEAAFRASEQGPQ